VSALRSAKIASAALFLAVLSIAYLLVPEVLWSPVSIFSAFLLALYIAFSLIFVPRASRGAENASVFAFLGPAAVITAVMAAWGACALAVGLFGPSVFAWSMNFAGLCFFGLFWLYFNFSNSRFNQSLNITSHGASPTEWALRLERLALRLPDNTQSSSLVDFSKSFRFLASDVNGSPESTSFEISRIIDSIENQVERGDFDISSALLRIKQLISLRESELISLRSRL